MVVQECELVAVTAKMSTSNVVIDTVDSALQQAEESFGVHVNVATHVLAVAVIDLE